jgi:hypothetical protein
VRYNIPGDHPLSDHPLFQPGVKTGIITGQNPMFPSKYRGENRGLADRLNHMGLRWSEVSGKYGKPETSLIVHGPTREQMFNLGKEFGQESVVHGEGGKHTLLYTNGPNEGQYHEAHPHIYISHTEPSDNFTRIPGKGHLTMHFDFDKLHPSGLGLSGRSQ